MTASSGSSGGSGAVPHAGVASSALWDGLLDSLSNWPSLAI